MKKLEEYQLEELYSLLGFLIRVDVLVDNNMMMSGINVDHLKLWTERVRESTVTSIRLAMEQKQIKEN